MSLTLYDQPGSPVFSLNNENADKSITKLVYVGHFFTQLYFEQTSSRNRNILGHYVMYKPGGWIICLGSKERCV